MAGCRICSGELELKVQGNGATVTAEALSPSAHEPGRHGDLLQCLECGTVQQPVLPQGAELHEHLDDPVDAIDRCAGLLRPGGVLCVVTPDPSSLTARVAGARWWGYLPAHACLLPRATLRE